MLADLHFTNIYCSDINEIQGNIYIESANSNIKYKNIDALNINFPDSSFDVIGCKSLLGGISKNDPKLKNEGLKLRNLLYLFDRDVAIKTLLAG